VRNRIALFSHTNSPSSQRRRAHYSYPAPSASLHRGAPARASTCPPQPPVFTVRGARVRPLILFAEALHVDQRRGQVRLIPPLPHGHRGHGIFERHCCRLRRRAGETRGGLIGGRRGGSSTGLDDNGEAGQGRRGVARSKNRGVGEVRTKSCFRQDNSAIISELSLLNYKVLTVPGVPSLKLT
jgi:hypothetical protein